MCAMRRNGVWRPQPHQLHHGLTSSYIQVGTMKSEADLEYIAGHGTVGLELLHNPLVANGL